MRGLFSMFFLKRCGFGMRKTPKRLVLALLTITMSCWGAATKWCVLPFKSFESQAAHIWIIFTDAPILRRRSKNREPTTGETFLARVGPQKTHSQHPPHEPIRSPVPAADAPPYLLRPHLSFAWVVSCSHLLPNMMWLEMSAVCRSSIIIK